MHGIAVLRRIFCRCNKSFVSANSETEACMTSWTIHFPTTPPCSTKVDVLETGFSLSRMKNLGMTIELDPQGDKITCPAFGLFPSPAEYSTMGHIELDLPSLTYQPTTKSRERPLSPKETCNLCHVRAKIQPIQLVHQTCMKMKMKMRMTNHLCSHHQGKNLLRKNVTHLLTTETLYPWFLQDYLQMHQCGKEKGPSVWQDPTATLEQEVSGDSRERAEDTSMLGKKKAEGEVLHNIISKLSVERNLRDLNLKHYNLQTTLLLRNAARQQVSSKALPMGDGRTRSIVRALRDPHLKTRSILQSIPSEQPP